MKENLSNIAVVRACWSAIICKYKYPLCVSCLCFLSVFSLCVFSLWFFFSICVFCLCYLSVLSVCVFCLCFLSGFAFYRTTKNDTFLRINFDIILLWSGLADQLLFADINSQLIWLQYKYKILTRYFGLSGSPASSCVFSWHLRHLTSPLGCKSTGFAVQNPDWLWKKQAFWGGVSVFGEALFEDMSFSRVYHQEFQVPKMEVLKLIKAILEVDFPPHKPYIQLT